MTNDIRVKALEWKKSRLPGEENILCAESPFGVYRAHVYNSFCRASLDYRTIADFAALPTLEEAKAACQADFARRVGECVEVGDALKARCDKLEDAASTLLAHLVAAVSVIKTSEENGNHPSCAYGSDTMYRMAMKDFDRCMEVGRKALRTVVDGGEQ